MTEPRARVLDRSGPATTATLALAPALDPASATAVAIYTCPMHPQIRQPGPGNCPICGMTLEPVEVTAQATPNNALIEMSRRFWVGLVLALPVFVLEMGGHIPALGLHRLVPMQISIWIQFVLSTPVVLWAGWPFFSRGWTSLSSRHLNMFTLVALGTGAAYLYSLVATFLPGLFPAAFRGPDGTVPVYYEAAAVITVLVLLGQRLELQAREQTGSAIRALLNLAPKTALRLKTSSDDEVILIAQVAVGDRLRVRPGDGIPVDGMVLEGNSAVDESMVTGESMPSAKQAGGMLIGGTVNGTGSLVMRADSVGSDTMLARIVAMVAQAQRSHAPIQHMADRVAGYFVPAVLAVATLAFGAWSIWGPPPSLSYALIAAVSVLIIACPCALGLATPMSIGVGIGKGGIAPIWILLANACSGGRGHEADESGLSGWREGLFGDPVRDATEIDGGGGQELLKMRLGRADVAASAQAIDADGFGEGSLDAGALFPLFHDDGVLVSGTCCEERFVFLTSAWCEKAAV